MAGATEFSILSAVRRQLRDPSLGVGADEGFAEQRISANLASYQPERANRRGGLIPGAALAMRQTDPDGLRLTSLQTTAAVVESESILGRLGCTFEQLGRGDHRVVGIGEAHADYVEEGGGLDAWDESIIDTSSELGWFDATAQIQATRRLLIQSAGIEDKLRGMLRRALASRIERGVIAGRGGKEPWGLLQLVLPTMVVAGGVATFSEAAGAVQDVLGKTESQPEQLAWLLSTADYEAWLTADGRSASEPLVGSGKMVGVPVFFSGYLPAGAAIVGDWSQLYVAMYGNPSLLVNPYTADVSFNQTRISLYQSHGSNVAYKDRFFVLKGGA